MSVLAFWQVTGPPAITGTGTVSAVAVASGSGVQTFTATDTSRALAQTSGQAGLAFTGTAADLAIARASASALLAFAANGAAASVAWIEGSGSAGDVVTGTGAVNALATLLGVSVENFRCGDTEILAALAVALGEGSVGVPAPLVVSGRGMAGGRGRPSRQLDDADLLVLGRRSRLPVFLSLDE